MIEFIENTTSTSFQAHLRAAGLPATMRYTVFQEIDGKVWSQSKAYGLGSTRYYSFKTYDEALEHGVKWAKRKIAEANRTK